MDNFFVIVGLGNPGRRYDESRHNVGFHVIDELVDRFRIGGPEKFGKSMIGKGRIGDRKVILVKPMTYMNLSGEAVREIVHYFRVDPEKDLLVISDDIDLEAGSLRIRKKGSAGGHNGLRNIVLHLGTENFARIRVGVGGKPDPGYDLADYVLGHFSKDEKKLMEDAEGRAAEAAACLVTDGIDLAMNRYNTPRKRKKKRAAADVQAGSGPEDSAREETSRRDAPQEQAAREDGAREETSRRDTPQEQAAREVAAREETSRRDAPQEQAAREDGAREETSRRDTPQEQTAQGDGALLPEGH